MKRRPAEHAAVPNKHVEHEHTEPISAVAGDALEKGLEIIYGEDRDDLHVVERGGSKVTRWLIRIVGVLAILAALASAGLYVYYTYFATSGDEESLTMQFEVQPTLKSGERSTVVLHYANPTSVPLASLEIDVNLPTTFRLLTADPMPTGAEALVWDLGNMPARTDGKLTLEGVWVAEVPSSTSLQALANYKPGNFNAYFHEITSASITTTESLATLSLAGPESVSPGLDATYTATVSNTGTETFSGAELSAVLPEGFFVTQTEPELEGGTATRWTIGDLAPGASLTYVFAGTFASDISGIATVGSTLGVSDGTRVITQASSSVFTDVIGSSLQLDMVVNGATGDVTADPGSTLRTSLRIQNTGMEALTGVTALLDFQSDGALPITWSEAALDGGRITAAGIVYDTSLLGDLAPGERVLFNLAIPLKADVSASASTFSLTLSATSGATTVQAKPVQVSLNSDASFKAEARYFDQDGAPLGSGPLPPKVGETTSYRVLWLITNGLHELEDISVSTTLPSNGEWDDFSSADLGSVVFDTGTRTVRWTVSNMPNDVQTVRASFSLSITPTDEEVGEFIKLTTGSSLQARDGETGSAIERQNDELTTELETDDYAQNKGIVTQD